MNKLNDLANVAIQSQELDKKALKEYGDGFSYMSEPDTDGFVLLHDSQSQHLVKTKFIPEVSKPVVEEYNERLII